MHVQASLLCKFVKNSYVFFLVLMAVNGFLNKVPFLRSIHLQSKGK